MRALKWSVLPVAAAGAAAAISATVLFAGDPPPQPTPEAKAPLVAAAAATAGPAWGEASKPESALPKDNDFIVHEWGTFTSFSGSDGVSLDFRPLVDEDLPKFVMDRPRQQSYNTQTEIAYAKGRSIKGTVISRQRMETPVTYFYTDKERIVDVTVEFPRGLLTEFYPPVRQFGPDFKKDQPEPLEKSFLRWGKVRLIPQAEALARTGADPYIPKVAKNDGEHYAYARETDSAHIQLTNPALLATFREKFLFYRGVGNFDLPVSLKSEGEGRFTLSYSGKTPLRYAFLVQIDGSNVRFAKYSSVSSSTTPMKLPAEASTPQALADAMVESLVSEGLYEKEARAMVKTWQSSWFGEQGTRVLYSLPQSYTDALLPLKMTPAPKDTLRVMIGRLETLTPETERKVEALTAQLDDANPATRERVSAEIKKLGRFAEPTLQRIARTSESPETQVRAKALLKQVLMGKE